MTPPTPTSFHGVPDIRHPQPQHTSFDPKALAIELRQQGHTITQIAQLVGRGTNMVSRYVRQVPLPEQPLLTVNTKTGVVSLSDAIVKLLNLDHGQAIELEPARLGRSRHREWYLDLRPEAPGSLTITGNSRPQFKTARKLPVWYAGKSLTFEVYDVMHTGYKRRHDKPTSEKEYLGYYPLRLVEV